MERETLVEAVVSIVAVAMFLVVIVVVGVLFEGANHQLVGLGPFALIGSVAFFIVAMSIAGYFLAGQ
ncbi:MULTISPECIES: DUF7472 family protein [Halococcus]|uniref:DUF7472 family protein n=1 Tax=Halococcus TaxID=2249 RepID=UPI000E770903|nr:MULTISPECIES: hypothetical protein [Halococcus]RJT06826.1 hypothetical protein D3261_04775 [Halococcus sp. IIIV-5B]